MIDSPGLKRNDEDILDRHLLPGVFAAAEEIYGQPRQGLGGLNSANLTVLVELQAALTADLRELLIEGNSPFERRGSSEGD